MIECIVLGGLTLSRSNGKHVGLRDACFCFRGTPTADLADYLATGRRVNARREFRITFRQHCGERGSTRYAQCLGSPRETHLAVST